MRSRPVRRSEPRLLPRGTHRFSPMRRCYCGISVTASQSRMTQLNLQCVDDDLRLLDETCKLGAPNRCREPSAWVDDHVLAPGAHPPPFRPSLGRRDGTAL